MATLKSPQAWNVTKKKENSNEKSQLSVTTSNSISDSPNPQVKTQSIKQNFLNEKKSEWPIWDKITQFFNSSNNQVNKEVEQQCVSSENIMRITILPWDMFTSRSGYGCEYQYYYSEKNQKVYFYQASEYKDIINARNPYRQISQPPKNYKYQLIYTMPLKQGKKMIEERTRFSFSFFR